MSDVPVSHYPERPDAQAPPEHWEAVEDRRPAKVRPGGTWNDRQAAAQAAQDAASRPAKRRKGQDTTVDVPGPETPAEDPS